MSATMRVEDHPMYSDCGCAVCDDWNFHLDLVIWDEDWDDEPYLDQPIVEGVTFNGQPLYDEDFTPDGVLITA